MSLRCVVACALLLRAVPAAPAEEPEVSPCVAAAVAAIQKRYESVKDLRARFVQTTRSVALGAAGSTSRSSGRVLFAKPGKMRWSYEEPEESLVVSDGEWLWLYDPANREAQKYPVGGGFLSAAAIQFLLGEGDLLRDFRVEEQECSEQQALLTLLPRAEASYEKLVIRADAARGDLVETEVVDLLGNVTRVAFRDVEANTHPDAALFRFEAPQGVEVIELTPPGAP